MAELDLSELMNDPDFASEFVVTRTQQSIDAHGRVVALDPVTATLIGSVQPASGRTMRMYPDLTNVDGAIEIWTKSRLEVASTITQADTITWNGQDYTVYKLDTYTNFGEGFVHVVCALKALLAPPPSVEVVDTGP